MGYRRRPKTFSAWLFSFAVIALISWFGYQYRMHRLEQMTNYRLERVKAMQPKPERQVQLTPE